MSYALNTGALPLCQTQTRALSTSSQSASHSPVQFQATLPRSPTALFQNMQLQLLNVSPVLSEGRRRNARGSWVPSPLQIPNTLHMKAGIEKPGVPRRPAVRTRLQAAKQTTTETVLSQVSSSTPKPQPTWAGFKKALVLSGGTALGGAVVAMYINQFTDPSCTITGTCSPISDVMKALLIGTHLYSFLLIPAAMYVFYSKIDELQAVRARSPFVAVLGLSLMMVAIMGEIGWHIGQDWFYKEEYDVLNMSFYFFLISGLSAWAFGLRVDAEEETVTQATPFLQAPFAAAAVQKDGLNIGDVLDYFLLATPALTLGLYGLGAEAIHSKVPIYIMMSTIFAVLTWRFWKVLKTPKVLLFPFFSVGVNLGFIALLNKYQTNSFLNPLFHILHDAAGTLLGILIIAVLTYQSQALAEAEE